jgi:hypothetical protein
MLLPTSAQMEQTAKQEAANQTKKSDVIKAGTDVSTKRKGGQLAAPLKRQKAGETTDVDIVDSPGQAKGADSLNMPYILWGHSQRPKIAGVCTLGVHVV